MDLNPLMASPEKLLMLQERVMHERLAHICHCDYDREIALLAETTNVAGEQELMREVRLSKLHGTNEARLSILIGDPYQDIGLGSEMVRWAVKVARHEGLNHLNATPTVDNQLMLHIFQKLGFSFRPGDNEKLALAMIEL